MPARLQVSFRTSSAEGRRAIATPGDILLHIRADQMDLCFELATQLMTSLGEAISVVDEVQGFRYFDTRSILGFVDGTENPVGRKIVDFTIVGNEGPALEPLEPMLENMFVGRPPGNYDRLLDFCTAVTGSLFFVPSADLLEELADRKP